LPSNCGEGKGGKEREGVKEIHVPFKVEKRKGKNNFTFFVP